MADDPMINEAFDEELTVSDYKLMLDNCQEHVNVLEYRIKELVEHKREIHQKNQLIKELEEKLSEFMDGLPIEKADKKKRYIYNCLGDILIVRWHEPSNKWLYYCEDDESDKEFNETHVHRFPSYSSETKEGK